MAAGPFGPAARGLFSGQEGCACILCSYTGLLCIAIDKQHFLQKYFHVIFCAIFY